VGGGLDKDGRYDIEDDQRDLGGLAGNRYVSAATYSLDLRPYA